MELELHRITPGQKEFQEFLDLPKEIYPEGSQRFQSGNDPVVINLEACYLIRKDNKNVARFALYINPKLEYEGMKTITFGSFECIENEQIALQVIGLIEKRAKELGFDFLLGPMEGSTWNNYRFSDHNRLPNFLMEPYHHDYYSSWFKNYGFEIIAEYYSNRDTELKVVSEDLVKAEKHFNSLGIHFRTFDLENAEEELKKIARFCNLAFQNNFLFTPIKEEDFANKYLKFLKYFDPELILIAERENKEVVALIFNIQDHNNKEQKSLIIKSLARLKDKDLKGIGAFIVYKTYEKAIEKGFESVIHAMMIKENSSVDLSEKYHGEDYKSYSLFGKKL